MIEDFRKSVVLIESSERANTEFGTGFVIHISDRATYVLTCAHVINAVGGPNRVIVDSVSARVISIGEMDSLDLAVLRIDEALFDQDKNRRQPFGLSPLGKKGLAISIIGFTEYDNGKYRIGKPIEGKLGASLDYIPARGSVRFEGWNLEIGEGLGSFLEPGYSGSPVIDLQSGNVLGIVHYREGKGETGKAISIDYLDSLEAIWKEVPKSIIKTIHPEFPTAKGHPIRIAIIAMNQQEATLLERKGTREYQRIQELMAMLKVDSISQIYGNDRGEWRPFGVNEPPIKEIVQSIVASMRLDVDYVVDKILFAKEDKILNRDGLVEHGGILIIDPVSLYHPELSHEFLKLQLLGIGSLIAIVVSPLTTDALEVSKILEKDVYSDILQIPFHHFLYDSKSLHEIGIGRSISSLQRRLLLAFTRLTTQEISPSSEQRQGIAQGRPEKTGISKLVLK
jgi:hypothetical protein